MDTEELQHLFAIVDARIESVQNTVDGVAAEVSSLSKVLIVGNGQPALTVRMAIVERESSETRKDLFELKTSLKADRDARDHKNWQSIALVISTMVSLATALISVFLKH
jgi:hypothetical protein